MTNLTPNDAIVLDGGTSNTRARLVRKGRVIATVRRSVGVRDTVLSNESQPVARAVRECIEEICRQNGGALPQRVVASGMLSSEVGLASVPHVIAPAGIDELAHSVVSCDLPAVGERPIDLVPGVRTPPGSGRDGWAEADVMRGEECETLGAWLALPDAQGRNAAFLWPGSHTKLVAVNASGQIVRSYTTLAGELTQALARHTLLAASLPEELPSEPDTEAFATGLRLVEDEGLGRMAFLVRVAALTSALGPSERAAFWVGAVIGDDVARIARHAVLAAPVPVWVGGRQPQRTLYSNALAMRHSGPVHALDDDLAERAPMLGALAIAERHAELRQRSA